MSDPDPYNIMQRLNLSAPPCDIGIIQDIMRTDWNSVDDADLDIWSDIIVRIAADWIASGTFLSGAVRDEYQSKLFHLAKAIDESNMLERSEELEEYLKKLLRNMNDDG